MCFGTLCTISPIPNFLYPTGQVKLQSTSVLIVGAGGLGCPAAVYLAAAGIGKNLHLLIIISESKDKKGLSWLPIANL